MNRFTSMCRDSLAIDNIRGLFETGEQDQAVECLVELDNQQALATGYC